MWDFGGKFPCTESLPRQFQVGCCWSHTVNRFTDGKNSQIFCYQLWCHLKNNKSRNIEHMLLIYIWSLWKLNIKKYSTYFRTAIISCRKLIGSKIVYFLLCFTKPCNNTMTWQQKLADITASTVIWNQGTFSNRRTCLKKVNYQVHLHLLHHPPPLRPPAALSPPRFLWLLLYRLIEEI